MAVGISPCHMRLTMSSVHDLDTSRADVIAVVSVLEGARNRVDAVGRHDAAQHGVGVGGLIARM